MKDLLKIDRPPAAEHWSRMQSTDVQVTAKKIFNFLRGSVSWNYNPMRQAARYYIEDEIDRRTAVKVVSLKGNPLGRNHNLEAIHAFFDYVEERPIVGLKAFSDMVEWFPIAPKAAVPIKPLTVTREAGSFVPTFLNPWSAIAFDSYQASLYMSILERSLFRLTDFEDSPGRIIFTPKFEIEPKNWIRKVVIWERGQFPLLSDAELSEQIKIFAEGKEIAKVLFREYQSRTAS